MATALVIGVPLIFAFSRTFSCWAIAEPRLLIRAMQTSEPIASAIPYFFIMSLLLVLVSVSMVRNDAYKVRCKIASAAHRLKRRPSRHLEGSARGCPGKRL